MESKVQGCDCRTYHHVFWVPDIDRVKMDPKSRIVVITNIKDYEEFMHLILSLVNSKHYREETSLPYAKKMF